MANWLRVNKPHIETAGGFLEHETAIINLDAASNFAVQVSGTVTIFIEGKAYVIEEQMDGKAYQTALEYIKQRTQGQSLP